MKINLCCIVKDDTESKQLEAMLDTIQPFVDGVYVTVTSEYTPKIDKLAKQRQINLSRFKWCDDFSKARNFNFSQVTKYTTYILWCDVDDLWLNGDLIRPVAEVAEKNGKDVVFFTYWYGCTFDGEPGLNNIKSIDIQHLRERLIRPGTHTWQGRLHETPVPVSGQKNNYTNYSYHKDRPVAVVHTAPEDMLPEKMERNRRILELQLQDERKEGKADPRTLLYLSKIYVESDLKEDLAKVLEYGDEYIQRSGWDEERAVCWELMGVTYGKLGEERKASECFHQAIKEWPHQPMFYLRLAQSYYNQGHIRTCNHWLTQGMSLEVNEFSGNMVNFKEMKIRSAELMFNLAFHHEKNVEKALKYANLLYRENQTDANLQNLNYVDDLVALNTACKHVDKLSEYLDSIGSKKSVIKILDSLPIAISSQPFAIKLRQKYSKPRVWGDNEICYFANFGQKHFEKWSPDSLKEGIGGSETAVIKLAQEWAKLGYKVTVYADPPAPKDYDGVTYLPYYYFNPKDKFNIFIQWRNWALAGQIKAKKFLVDLHDVFNGVDIKPEQLDKIDYFMVKSNYHRNFAPDVPDYKFKVISNGI